MGFRSHSPNAKTALQEPGPEPVEAAEKS